MGKKPKVVSPLRLCEAEGRYVSVGDLKNIIVGGEHSGSIRVEVLKDFFEYLIEIELGEGSIAMLDITYEETEK